VEILFAEEQTSMLIKRPLEVEEEEEEEER
jgi:hypothetical protein